jgi:hypothetical protein
LLEGVQGAWAFLAATICIRKSLFISAAATICIRKLLFTWDIIIYLSSSDLQAHLHKELIFTWEIIIDLSSSNLQAYLHKEIIIYTGNYY